MSVQELDTKPQEFDVRDVEYLRHGDKPLLIRLTVPKGAGPFPALVELHGGVWTENDRTRSAAHHEAFARAGVAIASVDFRQGTGGYPNSLKDINYAIRWAKAHAKELKSRPDLIGITGTSSGGHLAMLAAMRPNDPTFSSIPLPAGSPAVDASVKCVVMFWPVIDPLGRHHNAKRVGESTNPPPWPPRTMRLGMAYWTNEANMAEGSPLLAIKRGDKVNMPPAVWIQTKGDLIHDYTDPNSGFAGSEAQRFADMYKKAGGKIDLHYYDAPLHFTNDHPELPESQRALSDAIAFTRQQIPVK
jgi:acetyl esterase/lipase